MATIDKTYLNDYKLYKEFLEWAKQTQYKCPDGTVFKVYNYTYDYWEEKDFEDGYKPVICTPEELDYFLLKYCPFQFVQDRLRVVYSDDWIESVLNGTNEFDTFKHPGVATSFKIIKKSKYLQHRNYFFNSKNYYNIFIEATYKDDTLWFSTTHKEFYLPFTLSNKGGISSCYCTRCYSIKALMRQLRKLKIPHGSIITVTGRYYYNDFIIKAL